MDTTDNEQNAPEIKEEEVRAEVIKEYGFDPESDKERIEKATKREMGILEQRNTAIGQKIKQRTDFESYKTQNPPKTADTGEQKPPVDVSVAVNEALEKRDLEDMPYPDEIKKVIQNVAKINGVSMKKAATDPYVAAKIESWKKTENANGNAISRNNKTGAGSGNSNSTDDIPEFDMSTEEGRKGWDDWKRAEVAKGN